MISAKRTRHTARKKYVPSEKQRADDERVREELQHADIDELKRLMKPLIVTKSEPEKKSDRRSGKDRTER